VSDSSPFVHLHVHSEFSLLDGAIQTRRLLDKCRNSGHPAVAVTDHGNMFGAVQFYDQASKAGIKPIIGCEVYVAPGDRKDKTSTSNGGPSAYHLILLVTNEEGYKNLSRLVTLGHLEGFYYHPRVDMALLREFSGGLIALSACLKGVVPYHIGLGQMETARKKTMELAAIFSGDRFFLEVQANRLPEQLKVNDVLRDFSRELSLPMVATNDCHYLNQEDAEAHDVLLCIQTGKSVDDAKRMKFSANEFFYKTRDQMEEALPGFEEALDNTCRIADQCQYEMVFGRYKYPVFQVPVNKSLNEILVEDATRGLEKRLARRKKAEEGLSEAEAAEYGERLRYELKVIQDMGFSGYFLIVADFIDYARGRGIPVGPGRGSAAGSLVAYALGITNVDPIKYGLLFERFLNPQRISMPDIDIDFCINGRDEVIRYVAEKYGRENVSQIITFGTMKARAVIRDVGRSLNIPLAEVDRIAKLVPEGPKVSLEKAMEEEPELKRLEEDKDYARKLLSISRSLEGLARHASTHASGVVIADRPLVEYLPLFKGSRDEIMTQFTMDRIEQLGLIKFDFLGLKTLTVIKQAVDLIRETDGAKLDMDEIALDDPAVYRLCGEGKTTGVFQLESSGMKDLLRRLKPETFEDLVALIALYRPGPLGSNMTDDFINRKHGRVKINYLLPQLEPVLRETYGVILYQEQVMKIAQILADYTLAEADELRKAIGKKKQEVMERHRARFMDGALRKNTAREKAERLFDLMEKFGGYGFNKSHSVAYALIAYQTAYLKAHYPVQFMAALLTQDMGNQDKTIKNIAECREMSIEILPPDVNESQADFSVVDGKIRFGLGAVKNVGLKAVESVIEDRNLNGPFRDLLDFCRRIDSAKVNRRVLEGLIQCGAFDFTGMPRAQLYAGLDEVVRWCGCSHDPNQLSMFGGWMDQASSQGGPFEYPAVEEWSEKEKLRREKEALGFYITGHPLSRFSSEIGRYTSCLIQDLPNQPDKSQVKVAGVVERMKIKRTKKGDKMATFNLEDETGAIEVILFPDLFSRCAVLLKTEDPLLVSGYVELGENTAKIIAQDVDTLESIRQSAIRVVEIPLEGERVSRGLLEDLRDLVFKHPGDCKIRFKVSLDRGGEVKVSAHDRFSIEPSQELIHEIEALTGSHVQAWGAESILLN
jgi:DNA polymerase-3 subunit alpha